MIKLSEKIEKENKYITGMTLIEIMIAVTLMTFIAGLGFYALNPAGQLAQSRNTQRKLHLTTFIAAIRQNIADKNTGVFNCASGDIPTSTKKMASTVSSTTYNIAPCLVPVYVPTLPFDPTAPQAHYTSASDYDTGYTIVKNSSSQITISAPYAEQNQSITITR
jgi:type II secretory pathway pseudopilin PulG